MCERLLLCGGISEPERRYGIKDRAVIASVESQPAMRLHIAVHVRVGLNQGSDLVPIDTLELFGLDIWELWNKDDDLHGDVVRVAINNHMLPTYQRLH